MVYTNGYKIRNQSKLHFLTFTRKKAKERNERQENGSSSTTPGKLAGSWFGSWSDKEKEWFKKNPEKARIIKKSSARAGLLEIFETKSLSSSHTYGDAVRLSS